MNLSDTLFQIIDTRSFTSLWYWIGLAVIWSSMSHWVLGVPYDMITRARKQGGQAETDLMDMIRINVTRILEIARVAGIWLLAFNCFVLTALGMLGFWYGLEFAQAVFLIALPMSFVGAISLSTSRLIEARNPEPPYIYKVMLRHRLWTQIIGMCAIFVTAMYGMYHNLSVPHFF